MKRPGRPLLGLALAALLLAAPPSVAREDAVTPPTPAELDRAIEQGVEWLREEERVDGTWGTGRQAVGRTILASFALVHAGVDPEGTDTASRALARALAWLEKAGVGRPRQKDAPTYEASLTILLLRDLGREGDERIDRLVETLERAQAENGQWSYDGPRPDAGDNSNSQFAVLALGAAAGMGRSVDRDVLREARRWWLRAAQGDGGFGYSSGGSTASASTGSMTAAGIASLAVLDASLGPATGGVDGPPPAEVARRARELLAKEFRVDRNFGPPHAGARERQRAAGHGWLHYYLWSVERAMVLAGVELLDGHDWYAEGVAHLLAAQRRDGSWRSSDDTPLSSTCFALLFLTRATDPPRVFTPTERPRGPVTAPAVPALPPAPGKGPRPLRPLADLLREGGLPADLVASALAEGPGVLLPLARALGARDAGVRRRANETLRALLGDDVVGTADRHPLARGRLIVWIRANAPHLRAGEGRFR